MAITLMFAWIMQMLVVRMIILIGMAVYRSAKLGRRITMKE